MVLGRVVPGSFVGLMPASAVSVVFCSLRALVLIGGMTLVFGNRRMSGLDARHRGIAGRSPYHSAEQQARPDR